MRPSTRSCERGMAKKINYNKISPEELEQLKELGHEIIIYDRECLRCEKKFKTPHRYNRLCNYCKLSPNVTKVQEW